MLTLKNLDFAKTTLKDGFWRFYSDLDRSSVVKHVYDRFKETGRFDALRCMWREGEPNKPHIFWDSDVAKWREGVAYLLERSPEPEWEALVDEMVDNIAANQRADGYFNSYFLTVEPSKIFCNRDWHELYCVGHMIEAAIAYHKATGKDKLLNCVLKNVDMIYRVFVEEQSAAFVTPGHEEIEFALIKLYDYLGNEKHLELARFFLDGGYKSCHILNWIVSLKVGCLVGNQCISACVRFVKCILSEIGHLIKYFIGNLLANSSVNATRNSLSLITIYKVLTLLCHNLWLLLGHGSTNKVTSS